MTAARRIALATLVAGTLDIGFAAINTAAAGKPIAGMLRSVASGPFADAPHWGAAGAAAGLAVHFGIMAVMAAVFVIAVDRIRWVRNNWLLAGLLYGFALWLVMYGVVLPQRFGSTFPTTKPIELAKQLFAHIGLVGLPIALIARRG
jgi:hypothetical protein